MKRFFDYPLVNGIIVFIIGVAALIYVMCSAGCASVSVTPKTGEIKYYRIGNQTIQDVDIETPAGWKVRFTQDSKTEAMKTALGIAEALK